MIWERMVWNKQARLGRARQIPKPGLFGFFAFFSKAAGGKRWVGGASRKP